MDVPQIVGILGNFGFPVVIALYLLMRFEKKIDSLTDSISQLQQFMNKKL
ncbi:YvrJ family protein [Ferdinandcohnia sp. SAFN-114]